MFSKLDLRKWMVLVPNTRSFHILRKIFPVFSSLEANMHGIIMKWSTYCYLYLIMLLTFKLFFSGQINNLRSKLSMFTTSYRPFSIVLNIPTTLSITTNPIINYYSSQIFHRTLS